MRNTVHIFQQQTAVKLNNKHAFTHALYKAVYILPEKNVKILLNKGNNALKSTAIFSTCI